MLRIRIAAFRGRPLNGDNCTNIQHMEINGLGTTNALTSVGKDNMVYIQYE
nr:MAG TPA: RNAseH-like protein [Caudoviricetes sp.]